MNPDRLLAIVAVVQGVLLAGLLTLIVLNRWFRVRRRAHVHPSKLASDEAFRRWLHHSGHVASVQVSLAHLPTPVAIDQLVTWVTRVPAERWSQVVTTLERPTWARLVRSNAQSARWWKRLECARFLAVAGTKGDVPRLRRLLADSRPAVHVAAVAALDRIPDAGLAAAALERVPNLGPTVQAYYATAMKAVRPFVVGKVAELLRTTTGPTLHGLVEFARRLKDPALWEPLHALFDHHDAEMRAQAARALGAAPRADSPAKLEKLANDPAWPVRAQAVRALGVTAAPMGLLAVRRAMRDPEWWVRLRAGLALTQFGGRGRDALLEEEIGPHAGARDVARLVLGLSPRALEEYSA